MRYLAKISYDGSKFYGFQRLNKHLSVQKVLEDALTKINKKEVVVKGAGRTDRGVHALDQGVSFKLSTYSNLESSITFYINGTGLLYSSYQHATSSVTLNQSKNYTISSLGYGNTTLFANSVAGKYDGMAGVYIPV